MSDNDLHRNENIMPEVEAIDDSPLYQNDTGSPWSDDNDTGWKTVDFGNDRSDTDEEPLTDTGSGGGDMPPPIGPGTSSCDDDQEPERPRSTFGAPSTALITLKTEHSEHSEHSETYSSTDFEDPDWISPNYPESLWVFPPDIGDPYCEEFMKNDSVKYTALNAAFFARLVVLWANLHKHHGDWYAYSERTGTWCRLSVAELLNIIHRCVMSWNEKTVNIMEIVKLCSTRFCKDVVANMIPFPDYVDIFDHKPKNVINVKNGTLVVGSDGSVVLHEHSPEFLCRGVIGIDYDPTAKYDVFVREAFRDVVSLEDIAVIKLCAGQIALGRNFSQKILIISGEAGTGKSIIVKVLVKVLGRGNYEELRTSMLDQRFETSRFEGKSLLIAPDQYSDALMKRGAHMLKALTGGDDLSTERKCENDHAMISGNFNVVIISNANLHLSLDGDNRAWGRRLLLVKYEGKEPDMIIESFDDYLIHKYPKEILNWIVDGAATLFKNGKRIKPHPEMLQRIDELLRESDAFYTFVKNCVVYTGNQKDVLFSRDLYARFTSSGYFVGSSSKQIIQTKLGKAMVDVYKAIKRKDIKGPDGKAKYGYVGYRLERNEPE